jgi:hypothetical protein
MLIPILSPLLSTCVIKHRVTHHEHDGYLNVDQKSVDAVLHFYWAVKLTVKGCDPHTKVEEASPEKVFKESLFDRNARECLTILVTHLRKVRQGIWNRRLRLSCQQRVVIYDHCGSGISVQDHVYLTSPACIILLVNVYLRCGSLLILKLHWSESSSSNNRPI